MARLTSAQDGDEPAAEDLLGLSAASLGGAEVQYPPVCVCETE